MVSMRLFFYMFVLVLADSAGSVTALQLPGPRGSSGTAHAKIAKTMRRVRISDKGHFTMSASLQHGTTGQEASSDAQRHIAAESQKGVGTNSVLICMTGQVRTFGYTAAHESMLQSVVLPLSTEASVETRFILSYDDFQVSNPYAGGFATTFFDNSRIVSAIKEFKPASVTVMEKSSCAAYKQIAEGPASSPCYEPGGWLQLAWVNLCFNEGRQASHKRFTHYMRMRPDSVFASKLPSLQTFPTNMVSTWVKTDAVGNDQWFLFADKMYDSWWAAQVSDRIHSGNGLTRCCPENKIWLPGQIQQRYDVKGCLLRSLNAARCWGNDVDAEAAAKWQTKEDTASQKTDFSEFVDLLTHSSLPHFRWVPLTRSLLRIEHAVQTQECRCERQIFGDESGMHDVILTTEGIVENAMLGTP